MSNQCETCSTGKWERGWLTGEPSFVHADGRREFYYECEYMEEHSDDAGGDG